MPPPVKPWSVKVDKFLFSAIPNDAPTTYAIYLTFTHEGNKAVRSSGYAIEAASKVPGGPGVEDRRDDLHFYRIYELNKTPRILGQSMTQPNAAGIAEVTIEMLVDSKIPEDREYTQPEKDAMREFYIGPPPPTPPRDLSTQKTIKVMASFVSGGTHIVITMPVTVV
jgi:hypothetical protein